MNKKIFILLIIVGIIGFYQPAFALGSRTTDRLMNALDIDIPMLIEKSESQEARILSLEARIAELEKNKCSCVDSKGSDRAIEERLSYLEEVVDRLQITISNGLKSIIAILISGK
jgi:hypothetical protein